MSNNREIKCKDILSHDYICDQCENGYFHVRFFRSSKLILAQIICPLPEFGKTPLFIKTERAREKLSDWNLLVTLWCISIRSELHEIILAEENGEYNS